MSIISTAGAPVSASLISRNPKIKSELDSPVASSAVALKPSSRFSDTVRLSDAALATLKNPVVPNPNPPVQAPSPLQAFTASFEAGDASADFNKDGFIDFTDFDAFVQAQESASTAKNFVATASGNPVDAAGLENDGQVVGLQPSPFDAFVNAFSLGDASSDFNKDGFIDFTDFDAFVQSQEAANVTKNNVAISSGTPVDDAGLEDNTGVTGLQASPLDAFLNAFSLGNDYSDFNKDGFIDFTDFDAFVQAQQKQLLNVTAQAANAYKDASRNYTQGEQPLDKLLLNLV